MTRYLILFVLLSVVTILMWLLTAQPASQYRQYANLNTDEYGYATSIRIPAS